jgi:hypothetical protein
MNRHQRRKAASEGPKTRPNIPSEPFFPEPSAMAPGPVAKAPLLVRGFAAIVLSGWVIRRVRHPAARAALALIAREVGRHDLATELER